MSRTLLTLYRFTLLKRRAELLGAQAYRQQTMIEREADVMEPVWTREGAAQALVPTSNISISKFFKNVNPKEQGIGKIV